MKTFSQLAKAVIILVSRAWCSICLIVRAGVAAASFLSRMIGAPALRSRL